MKVGFYKDDLEDFTGFYDIDDEDYIQEIAGDFADKNHQVDEESDMKFTVYVEDDNDGLHEVHFFTEYDPRYEVEDVRQLR